MFAGIPLHWIRRQVAGAVRQGLSLDDLLEASTIDLQHGDDRDLVTPAQFSLLCMNTMLGVDDAAHGLAKTSLGPLYPAIGLRMAAARPTLGEAFETLCRLYSLASTAVQVRVDSGPELARLSVRVDGRNDEDTGQLEEVYLGWMYMSCLYLLDRPLPVVDVTVRDPTHFNLGTRHWAMGGLVRRGDTTSFRFSNRFLSAVLTTRSGPIALWDCQRIWLDGLRDGQAAPAAADSVEGGRAPRFNEMVKASGKSANTVRRQLRSSIGGYRETRQSALVQAATLRLRSSNRTVEAIAVDLGYSDERGFRRFLKNATGLTPQQIRASRRAVEETADERALEKLKTLSERINL